jgi:hypothetical protein
MQKLHVCTVYRFLMLGLHRSLCACFLVGLLSSFVLADETAKAKSTTKFLDHSLLISSDYPCTWPTHPFPKFQLVPANAIGPNSPYNIDTLYLDGNTGTQLDTPPHSVARPEFRGSNP